MTQRPVRYGLIVTRSHLEAWESRCMDHLQAQGGVELALVIEAPELDPSPPASLLWRLVRQCLYRPRSGRWCSLAEAVPGVPRIPLAGALSSLRTNPVDFLLHCGNGVIPAELASAPPYGTWAFRHQAWDSPNGPPGLWSVFRGEVITPAFLHRCDTGEILREGALPTLFHSPSRNADQVCQESVTWPAVICRAIQEERRPHPIRSQKLPSTPFLTPTNGQALLLLLRTAGRWLRNTLETLFLDAQWNIGVVDQPIHRFLEPDFKPAVRWLPDPPRGRFAADCFVWEREGRLFLFFEDLDYRSYKGRIWGVELKGAHPLGAPVTVLDPPTHLSYPYLIDHQGVLYMVPESAETREVALYRAVELPGRWERAGVLLRDVPAVDSSLIEYEGRWWLFATLATETGDPNVNLCLWHAPALHGPWEPHPGNPVKTDIRSARPAGPPFVWQGKLYRPAQDCSRTYGGRVVLLRIDRLTPTEFQEEPVRWLDPPSEGPYSEGVHTLCGVGGMTVLDGKRTVFDLHACRHALRRKFGRIWNKLSRLTGRSGAPVTGPSPQP